MKPSVPKPAGPRKRATPSRPLLRWLVIGYGNELRGDDAAGPHAARAIEELALPNVEVFVRQQLTPELADNVSQADAAIFIDAAAEIGSTAIREACAAPSSTAIAHSSSPEALLSLAGAVFGSAPKAWLITVPIAELGFREHLSKITKSNISRAVAAALSLISGEELKSLPYSAKTTPTSAKPPAAGQIRCRRGG